MVISALGDYVHRTASGYRKYGTNRPEKGNVAEKYVKNSDFLRTRTLNHKKVSEETIAFMEQVLQGDSAAQEGIDAGLTSQQFTKTIDTIYQMLATMTDPDTLQTFNKNSLERFKYSGDIDQLIADTETSRQKILEQRNLYKKINDLINKYNQRKEKPTTVEELQEVANLYKQLTNNQVIFSKKNIKSTLGKIQNSLTAISFYEADQALSGAFGENLVAALKSMVENGAVEIVNNSISGVIGSTSNFIKATTDQVGFIQNKTLSSSGVYSFGTSQNKADVHIKINEEDVFANVKMYGSATQVTLQSYVNLVFALSYLNDYNKFAVHWLNMHASSNRLRGNKTDRTNADNILQQEIAYEALVAGNPLKRKTIAANVFIFIDKEKGRIKVVDVQDLLLNKFNSFKIDEVKDILLPNSLQSGDDATRINDIIAAARGINLYAGLKITNI